MISASQAHVIIIGAGFSGSLLAINLMRHDGPRATLIERHAGHMGRGVAYSAADPGHLLNVRAGNMSALPDEPDHFARWLLENADGATPAGFVPRTVYGRYLRSMLSRAQETAGDRLRVMQDEAVAVHRAGEGYRVDLANGTHLKADSVILAIGNLPPHTPPGLDPGALPEGAYAADPWAGDIADGLTDDDTVLLLGTGLTAIDAALLLDTRGFRGKIMAMSRRGLVPRQHVAGGAAHPGLSERPAQTLSALVRFVRHSARISGWRTAVDELRPVTQLMWGAADTSMRARFLRHLRPFWDVHRHRLAPVVAERIAALQASGRLSFTAGKTVSATPRAQGALLTWRPRHRDAATVTPVRRIVNCTGPQGDLLRTQEPLLRQLIADGLIRPDPLRLGLDVDAWGHVIDQAGQASDSLFCVGPMTRGGLWEVVAVPDLRRQSWDVARNLSNAHWIGGEGL